jgi:hypothetical protein
MTRCGVTCLPAEALLVAAVCIFSAAFAVAAASFSRSAADFSRLARSSRWASISRRGTPSLIHVGVGAPFRQWSKDSLSRIARSSRFASLTSPWFSPTYSSTITVFPSRRSVL